MNKLLINEGGQPLYLDDLDFMQNAFAETVKGIISTYADVILSGCNVLPLTAAGGVTTYKWNEGYLTIGGEVYKVDGGSFDGAANASLYWKVACTEGQKEVFENSSEHNVYQYRKVVLADTVTASDIYVPASSIKTMQELTAQTLMLGVKEITWETSVDGATLKMDAADIPMIGIGDVVEIILSIGMESTTSMGGYFASLNSYIFYVDTREIINGGAKPVAWCKTSVTDIELTWVMVNFKLSEGAFYVRNLSGGKLAIDPASVHKIVVYKNRKDKRIW